MEEKNTQPQEESLTANANPEKTECKCSKKLSGDLRTFVISLLTAVIVVLAYHGTLLAIRCAKKDCRPQKNICPMYMKSSPRHNAPQQMDKAFHHRRHMQKNMNQCPNCAKRARLTEEFERNREFKKNREFRRDKGFRKNAPESEKNSKEQKAEQKAEQQK